MKPRATLPTDRVESFISSIDSYEPSVVRDHETAFRVFARFVSRNIDGRYLDRHPSGELLADLEGLMAACLRRAPGEVTVTVHQQDDRQSRRAVLMTCMPDQGFIFSIVKLALDNLGLRTYRQVAAIVPVARDPEGQITAIGAADAGRESFIWVELNPDDVGGRGAEIERIIRGRLEAACLLVDDFPDLVAEVRQLAADFQGAADQGGEHATDFADNARLLSWLLGEHFVFLGLRQLPMGGAGPSGRRLGVGRFDDWRGMQLTFDRPAVEQLVSRPPFLAVRKSGTESWIYRAGHTDLVFIRPANSPDTLVVLEGLFSYQALAEPRTTVPLLDRFIDQMYQRLDAAKGTHRYRTIRNAFNSLPLEYLFSLPPDDVQHLVEQVLEADAGHRSQIHITLDASQRIAFVFVALPRSHYSDELKSDIRRLLKARLSATAVDDGVYAGNLESVTFHFFVSGAQALTRDDIDEVVGGMKAEIDQLASPWGDRLFDELVRRHGNQQARVLHHLYNEAFAHRYREETSIARAAQDIELLEGIGPENPFDCDIYQEEADRQLGITRLRMFHQQNLFLSQILPILDNFGLVVIDQFPTRVQVPGRAESIIATYRIGGVQQLACDLTTRRNRLRSAIRAVVSGSMTNDPLNRLLLHADIPWPSLVMILGYQYYARQIGSPYGLATVQEALLGHADIVRGLTELFRAKFDPEIEGQNGLVVDERRRQLIERSRGALLAQLEGVDDLVSDQVLRSLLNLIDATVRTNFYARDLDRQSHLVLKFDPSLVQRMPDPRPYREIFVFHPEVAGLHLRGGPVARGGIRWSDRLLDFRTEVLGLMSTQNLKNVLIVPRGAKGAFVLRNPTGDFGQRRQHADQMYRIFIDGLLDVTDNLVGGEVVSPANILCHDAPDHYLVVAADKGTAHLSDTANELAARRSFWLGDAFASGGSQGYDHKKEAITSRGAWSCVRRHFREMQLDPERDIIRVVGIGDMSGDVFGNGMLRSETIKLVAAFDHRNFFIDPDPDPKASFAARKTLFAVPRSSWEDYPKTSLSAGGGVYPRGAKSIKLHPRALEALGISGAGALSGPELVQAILRAPVDLLWNGGIGTYIKASHESNLDAGDLTNDQVRVNANEVRAKVIGEGGNLGVTAAGRVELANSGVRLNTDAVDNSAGVDLSDHEVNLKILFQGAKERGALVAGERDQLLLNMGQEVAVSVVHNNWLQSRMISLDVLRSRRDLARFGRAANFLAERTPFRRRDAILPDERALQLRQHQGGGLNRPELAFLAANAKLDFRQELGRFADAFTADSLHRELTGYFPPSLRERFADDIRNHPLGTNIARTMLTNIIIADVGVSWLSEVSLMTGRNTQEIVAAYFAAGKLVGAAELKQTIDRTELACSADDEYALRLRVEDALETVTAWMLRRSRPVGEVFLTAFAAAMRTRPQLMPVQDGLAQATGEGQHDSLLGTTLGVLRFVDELLDTALLATSCNEGVRRAMAALHLVGDACGIGSLVERAGVSKGGEALDRPARLALREQLRLSWVQLAAGLLRDGEDPGAPSERARAWMEGVRREVASGDTGEQPLCNLVVAAERITRRQRTLFGDDLVEP